MTRGYLPTAVVLVMSMASSGCGYALAGRGSFLPAYIRTVGIPQIDNRTTFVRLEQVLTEKVRAEFISRGRYTIQPDGVGADAVLTGEITSFSVSPVGFTDQQLASRYLFTVVTSMRFTDARTGEVLWSDDAVRFTGEYDLNTRSNTALEGASFLDQEASSFDRIANEIARSIVTAILEAF